MSKPNTIPSPLEPLESWLRAIIREEIKATLNLNGQGSEKATDTTKPFLTIKEAADFSRLAPSTIRVLIRKRQLKAFQVGRRVIVKRSDLERFLEANPIGTLSD